MTFDEAMAITGGNREAAVFLCSWDDFCGMLDDVADDPGKVTDEQLVRRTLNLLGSLCHDGFARANAPRLFPIMVLGANAWLDANRLAKSEDARERVAGDVLKSSYREMERVVAYLCVGYGQMRAQPRTFDWDALIEQPLKED